MYAIIRTVGKQYRVSEGDVLNVERLEAGIGENISFDDVLAVGAGSSLRIGRPTIAGASVTATVMTQARAKKVIIFKIRRRKNSQRRRGHRQYFTRVRITGISG